MLKRSNMPWLFRNGATFILILASTYIATVAHAQKKDKKQPSGVWRSTNLRYAEAIKGDDITQALQVKDIVEATHDYNYGSYNKPNPFIPPLVSTLLAKEEIPITSVLQRYPLANLRLVGIWELQSGVRKGLVMTPKQEGVTVQLGDALGPKGGRITSIYPRYMMVRSYSLAPDGSRQFEDLRLDLEVQPPTPEDTIILRSTKIGKARIFGYGKDQSSGPAIGANAGTSEAKPEEETPIDPNRPASGLVGPQNQQNDKAGSVTPDNPASEHVP